jgi:RNA polymerase-binding transcription factor DksA
MAAAKKSPTKATKARAKAPAKKAASKAASKSNATATKAPAKKAAGATKAAAKKAAAPAPETDGDALAGLPKPRFNKDGIGYTKDFDLAFVKKQYDALHEERVRLTGQALRLEDEAHQLVAEAEMGDVQFDDEGGEGDTMVVERERDLALSAQAREAVAEIDAALERIANGTYGYSVVSGRPIPRERLEAIPWASVLVEEKVGGIGRR